MFRICGFVFALSLCNLTSAHAAVVTVIADSAGSYTGSQAHFANDYAVSAFPGLPNFSFRNYVVFDLSSVDDEILSAEIQTNSGGDVGRQDEVTISFLSFGGSIANLEAGNADYNSLDDGDLFASFFAPAGLPDDAPVTIQLNSQAVTQLNATSGLIAISGVQLQPTNTSGLFAEVMASQIQLSITTVPEPTAAGVLVLITSGLWIGRRRSRRTVSS